jgi:hypothetical protein
MYQLAGRTSRATLELTSGGRLVKCASGAQLCDSSRVVGRIAVYQEGNVSFATLINPTAGSS